LGIRRPPVEDQLKKEVTVTPGPFEERKKLKASRQRGGDNKTR